MKSLTRQSGGNGWITVFIPYAQHLVPPDLVPRESSPVPEWFGGTSIRLKDALGIKYILGVKGIILPHY